MARTEITVTQIDRDGAWPAQTAGIGDGHKFRNDGRTIVIAENTNASPQNITFQTPGTIDGLAIGDRVVAVPGTSTLAFGPFPPGDYNQKSGADKGQVYIDYGGTAAEWNVQIVRV